MDLSNDTNNDTNNDTTNESDKKNILITGTNNRYLIKRANRVKTEIKKRVIMNKYDISDNYLNYTTQLEIIKQLYNNNKKEYELSREKTILKQEIERKIHGYKQQDLLKKKYDESKFIDITSILQKLIDNNMQCYYCNINVVILYEIVRELTQWSVDRINNEEGHNKDNFVISCLNCNITRRKTNSNKFLLSKQLNLVKKV
jgi:hypothetical protein